jgi:prepilin-type N-terminal cleavage/methylation domain-containing protein
MKRNGFTLIELIVVIGIIAIMASAVIAVLNPLGQFQKSQDARRKSDLAQIQRGLEAYYQDYQSYPSAVDGKIAPLPDGTAVNWGSSWQPYMNVIPVDPESSHSYAYTSDGQSYRVYASLDRGSSDPQACNGGAVCTNATGLNCGGTCNYGVSSPNVSP